MTMTMEVIEKMEEKILETLELANLEPIDISEETPKEPWDKDMEFVELNTDPKRIPDFWERLLMLMGIDVGIEEEFEETE